MAARDVRHTLTSAQAHLGRRLLGETLLQELGDGTVELGQTCVNLDDFIRANRVCWVDVSLVFGPLGAAFAEPKEVTIDVRPVNVNRGVLELASADARSLSRFWVRPSH